jgi:hypothetical protein
MRTIKQDELFQSLNDFLKTKGIELKDGAYAQRIRRACNLLGDTINTTQKTARKAKDEVDKKLDQVRQSIHEATAPRPPADSAAGQPTAAAPKVTKQPRANRKRPAPSAKKHRQR